ncbi:PDR/VanB family oxidoreductase [Microbacterium sp. CIAB417]|uniref:PDR/VanB family oxidoreductase n=1 Tax=Microbacterium sp. CIAB417 TaxID=2860287 RepID=UPI001FAC17FA|nr:PDR/VanB family oxidoreductase [Microbacterium sp. CIAB417]
MSGDNHDTAFQGTFEVTVVARHELAEDVVEFELAPLRAADALVRYEAGAHLDVYVEDGTCRQYSLVRPTDSTVLRIAVLREEDGRGGSTYLHDRVGVGDMLRVGAPRNTFRLREAPEYLLIAGGIGVTPMVAMANELDRRGDRWVLHYLGRSRERMAYAAELEDAFPGRIQIHTPPDRADLADLIGALPNGTSVYACGPSRMLDALQEAVASRPQVELHVEHFSVPDVPRDHPANESFELELAQSGQILPVSADQSALDVLEDAGHFILSSCREGTCGSCEVRVLGGDVDHRDWLLDEAEKQRNDRMYVCVSRARSKRLTLDL